MSEFNMSNHFNVDDYPFQEECYTIIGIAMEIHRILGKGFSEIVYKDAFEYELTSRDIGYEREKRFVVNYKGIVLKHQFYADFVIDNKIILEIKSSNGIVDAYFAQVLNYLTISKLKVGLIINFDDKSLQYKRIVKTK